MITCIALYRGTKLSDLELVAMSTDRKVVADFATRFQAAPHELSDPVLKQRWIGQQETLRAVVREAGNE